LCGYGINYQWADADMLVAGLVVHDYPVRTEPRQRQMKKAGASVVSRADVAGAVRAYLSMAGTIEAIGEDEGERIIEEQIKKDLFKARFLDPLREEIAKGLAFFHDYKQINAQIVQNINVVIESHPGQTFEERFAHSTNAEKAIYEAAKFLEEKLNVAKFLLNPEWLYQRDECVRMRVHGLIHKYFKIYQPRFAAKRIAAALEGMSITEIVANPGACGVIPHTLIDNAEKYSPRSGSVRVEVNDVDEGVELVVSSYGPELLEGEKEKIFRPFYRGKNAREIAEEGAGYGLYVSQFVAREHLGTEIRVEQSPKDRKGDCVLTRFSVVFPMKAKILR
jgi:light-regulated signal transduction histidine kinase (bacteriophytochrome)